MDISNHNKTLFLGDNLNIIKNFPSETIDLIYLDLPLRQQILSTNNQNYKSLKNHHHPIYNFINTIEGINNKNYLSYLALRIIEFYRILKPTGNIYLHCNSQNNHYLKMLTDTIFKQNNFITQIIWNKGFRGTEKQKGYQEVHDIILFYSKNKNQYTWLQRYQEYKDLNMKRYNQIDEDGQKYALIKRKRSDGTVYYGKSYPKPEGKKINNVINIPSLSSTSQERVNYPSQKPLALIKILIETSSPELGFVLDPFAGSGTTCIACENLNRKWLGIEINQETYNLAKNRLKSTIGKEQELFQNDLYFKE